jgi:hypothetical protein
MHFGTFEHAQAAVALLADSGVDRSKAAISEMLFEGDGSILILKFASLGASPSELFSLITAVMDSISLAPPMWKKTTVPLM